MRLPSRVYYRSVFLHWWDGTLFEFVRGSGVVLDGSEIARELDTVEEFMDRGGTVYLKSDDGVVVSKLRAEGDGYVESYADR